MTTNQSSAGRLARLELRRFSHRLVEVQEQERRRVARELHDEVGQAISAVLVELGRLEKELPAIVTWKTAMTYSRPASAKSCSSSPRANAIRKWPSVEISLYTVETHRGNLMEKLNLHSVPELILYAVRKGVIS